MPGSEEHSVRGSISFKFKMRNKKNESTALKVKRGGPLKTRKGTMWVGFWGAGEILC